MLLSNSSDDENSDLDEGSDGGMYHID